MTARRRAALKKKVGARPRITKNFKIAATTQQHQPPGGAILSLLGNDLQNFIPWLTSSLTRHLHGVMTEALAPHGISIAEWRVILGVIDGRSYSLTDVTEFTGLNQSSLSRAIVRIENKGLVTRSRRRNDARLMNIEITTAGRLLGERTSAAIRTACDRELGALTRNERDTFVHISRKLLAKLPPPKREAGIAY